MKNNGIDDILIGASYEPTKSKGKGLVIIFFLLLIVLAGLFFVNYYLKSQTQEISNKTLFIEQISKTNINKFLNDELYEKLFDRLSNENFETENSVNFTNTLKELDSEYTKDIDISKFIINLNTKNDSQNNISNTEASLNYSGNDILNFKVITTENEIAFFSDEIYEKYVAVNYEDITKIISTSIDIDNLRNKNKVDLSKNEIIAYLKEYKDLFLDNLEDSNFSVNENYIIRSNNEDIEVVSYGLEVNQAELNKVLVTLLENIKQDQKLINKIITGKDSSTVLNLNENETPLITNIKIGDQEINLVEENPNSEFDFKEELLNSLLFGKRINISYNNFITEINNLIDYVKEYEGIGLKFEIYSSKDKVEKISISTPKNESIDIEFPKETSTVESKIKITYLLNETKDGFSLSINKIDNSATKIVNMIYSFIEDGAINKKINIDINTDGTMNSKKISNSIVFTYLTNSGETKCIIDNNIKFNENIEDIEKLNDSNCLFLNTLNEEDYTNVVNDLYSKSIELYNEKKDNLSFIDNNTKSIEDSVNLVTRDEARNALIKQVTSMMENAASEGRELTIQDLNGLTIDGYDVSTNINEENAVIVVDIYMFNLDKNFYLSDIQ